MVQGTGGGGNQSGYCMEPGQLGPVLASRMEGAAEGADSQRIDFSFHSSPPSDVGFYFPRQTEPRYENHAIWYDYILPSFTVHHLPHSLNEGL